MYTSRKPVLANIFFILALLAVALSGCGQAAPAAPAEESVQATLPSPATYTPVPMTEEEATATAVPEEEPTEAPAETGGEVNAWGVALPADAAPLAQQHLTILAGEGVTTDFAVSVYKRTQGNSYSDILTTPFVQLNKNFELLPAGALSWDVNADGTVWTFHMDPELTWSDGSPVMADDVVFTFQYEADPTHAWDFAWFWSDIVNWDEAVAGKVPTTEIGVSKVDDFTVEFHTKAPSPYFLSKALYVRPLSKVAFEKSGEYYNSTPETSVSSTPWKLVEWTKGKQMVFEPNTSYTGKLKPYIEKLTILFGDYTKDFLAYQNDEVDMAMNFSPADISLISADPQLSTEYHPGFGDFRTYYLGFNTEEKPFNDLKVREAFAKAIDRDAIIANVVGRQGIAAYSFLMPGFPGSTSDVLKTENVNQYDVAAAKQLLADAGYPDGAGFPAMELWLRNESDLNKAIADAMASMLKENLNIDVQVSNKEAKLFMDTLNAHKLPLYFLSYGFDYLDQSNMLGIWTSGGRHAWSNAEFDQLVNDASSLIGDNAKRDQMFKDAEKILVTDAGGVFIYHQTPGTIYKSFLKGSELEPDNTGVTAWHWPGLESVGLLMPSIYVSSDAPATRK